MFSRIISIDVEDIILKGGVVWILLNSIEILSSISLLF